ncbi:PEBP-like protein [Ramaria rubella]|nr:PEBP-like protein [Ramaria rubella]
MPMMQKLPPTNTSTPYGPIDILPQISSLQSVELVVTFNLPGSEPVSLQANEIQTLSWRQTESRPLISFFAEKSSATYTLIMTDPDAPTPNDTKYAYWRHWIQPGLRPSAPGEEAQSDKAPLTEYMAPGKKDPSADAHRYLFILFREPGPEHPYHALVKSDVGAENFEARRSFDAKEWISKYGLEPVALVWFWGSG